MEQDFLDMLWVGGWKYHHVTHTHVFQASSPSLFFSPFSFLTHIRSHD